MFGFRYYYGIDMSYIILVLPFVILSLWASFNVNHTFKKYSSQLSRRRITGAQAAEQILFANGVRNVRIERVSGKLTDHYDPTNNVIRLSENVYDSTSTAAIGVACHEAGHAIQYAENYGPIKFRSAIIPITNIGSKIAIPLILLGLILSVALETSGLYAFVYIGIACFSLSLIFQLVTLPVEFNASRRAIRSIEKNDILTEDEQLGAKRTLKAAALTYLAATAVTLMQLLRLIMIFGKRKD